MRRTSLLLLHILMLLAIGCHGRGSEILGESGAVRFIAVDGTSSEGITIVHNNEAITVSFSKLDRGGRFISIYLPVEYQKFTQSWNNDSDTLHVIVPTDIGLDLGVTPLYIYDGQQVSVVIKPDISEKSTNRAPGGHVNIIRDLIVSQQSSDQVLLEWTEVNTGDYDFNGEVSITDLVPLGQLLGKQIDLDSPNAVLNRSYWVDGDCNGEINIGDLTPIAQNYRSQISGYVIRRNGVIQPIDSSDNQVLLREHALQRMDLPAKYSIVIDGAINDFWEVAPVDDSGQQGTNNNGQWNQVDLKVKLDIDGIGLRDFENPEVLGCLGQKNYRLAVIDIAELMRRLDPGTVPDGFHIGNSFPISLGTAVFCGLPREQTLLLAIGYIPEYNLETGEAWPDGTALSDRIAYTYIPFRLPADGLAELDATLRVSKPPAGGATVGISTITRTATATVFVDKQLDCAQGLVSQDTDLDADFTDEAQLADASRTGVSLAQLDELLDTGSRQYNIRLTRDIQGELISFDEHTGMLTLGNAVATDAGGTRVLGEAKVYFDETADFAQVVVEPGGPVLHDVTPSDLAPGDEIALTGNYLLDSMNTLPEKQWAALVLRTAAAAP